MTETKPETPDQPTNESSNQLLDLSAPERIVRLRERDRLYHHRLQPLTFKDWEAYFAGFRSELITFTGGRYRIESKADAAACELWNKKVASVEGYLGQDGLDLDALRRRMPARHKIAAVALLQEAVPDDDNQDQVALFDARPVVLSINWNLQRHTVSHFFASPSQDDEIAHSRLTGSGLEVKGNRRGQSRILLPSQFASLCKVYDRLIQHITGYAWKDEPLGDNVEELRLRMDPVHKFIAASLLFGEPPQPEADEEGVIEDAAA